MCYIYYVVGKHNINNYSTKITIVNPEEDNLGNNDNDGNNGSNNNNESKKVIPVKLYLNAESDKDSVLKENKNKCGIYRWVNTVNGKTYVGSSVNLSRRFISYYNPNY